jgi:murein DD-endopeptidase MepM/ murein hydrolase activator NlpD
MSARGRHRRQRPSRLKRVSLVLTAGGAGVALPLIAAGGAQAASADSYTVQPGDSLYEIATEHDIDGGWQALYEANRDVVGDNPRLILPGQELTLSGAAVTTRSAPAEDTAAPAEEAPAEDTAAQGAASDTAVTGFVRPVDGPLGTAYHASGSMWSSGYHTGVDFSVGSGTPVSAITEGEVVTAGDGGAYGNQVVIRHADGHYSQYAHLSSISVSVGQQVAAGDQIGLSGSTGNSTGPHLHFEVRTGPEYGSDVDPVAYLAAHGVSL